MMALTLSVGFVVDDAIVMLENIVRHIEMGERPLQAALNGSKEVSFTIMSMTLSLAAVFIPVLFMGGILGRLLHEFAVVIGLAILVSGVVSLSLTPMMSSRFIHAHGKEGRGRLYDFSERLFDGMLRFYGWSLKRAIQHPRAIMLISGLILAGTIQLFIVMPKGFLPSEDTGMLFGNTEAAQGISYDSMVAHQEAVAKVLSQDPNIMSVSSSVGMGGSSGTLNNGRVFVRLKPRSERKLNADQVIEELRPKLSRIQGIRTFLQNLPPIRIGGHLTNSPYQYILVAPNTEDLYRYAPLLESELAGMPQFQDVTTDLQIRNPQVNIDIDRDKAASLGITTGEIESALYTAYGSRQVSTIYAPNNEYSVILELAPQYQMDPAALSLLYLRSNNGSLVPLNAVAGITTGVGPFQVAHLGQLPQSPFLST